MPALAMSVRGNEDRGFGKPYIVPQTANRRWYTLSVGPDDVLLGRGTTADSNQGNVRFRGIIQNHLNEYRICSQRTEKHAIALKIRQEILRRNGNFLRKIESPEELEQYKVPTGSCAWTFVDEATVLKKIKQAFRDANVNATDRSEKEKPTNEESPTKIARTVALERAFSQYQSQDVQQGSLRGASLLTGIAPLDLSNLGSAQSLDWQRPDLDQQVVLNRDLSLRLMTNSTQSDLSNLLHRDRLDLNTRLRLAQLIQARQEEQAIANRNIALQRAILEQRLAQNLQSSILGTNLQDSIGLGSSEARNRAIDQAVSSHLGGINNPSLTSSISSTLCQRSPTGAPINSAPSIDSQIIQYLANARSRESCNQDSALSLQRLTSQLQANSGNSRPPFEQNQRISPSLLSMMYDQSRADRIQWSQERVANNVDDEENSKKRKRTQSEPEK